MARTARDFDRWVKITLLLKQRTLELRCEDETARVCPGSEAGEAFAVPAPRFDAPTGPLRVISALIDEMAIPRGLEGLLSESVAGFNRTRPHLLPGPGYNEFPVPWLLPIFVVAPAGLEALPWEAWLQHAVLDRFGPLNQCVPVRLRETRGPLSPLALPLRVFDERRSATMDFLRARSWFAGDESVRSHGIVLEDAQNESPARASPHVFITESSKPPRRIGRRRLRLIVWIDQAGGPAPLDGVRPLIRLTPPSMRSDSDPIANIVYALLHDFALHEIAWILARSHPGWAVEVACDPLSNHALRMSRTLTQIRDDVFAGRIVRAPDAGTPWTARNRVLDARYLTNDFTRESRGFSSMARFLASAFDFGEVGAYAGLEGAPNYPRRVEMALDRYDEFGVPEPIDQRTRRMPLRCGWRYRLRFQIGLPDPDGSLFEIPPPSLDELLPPAPSEEGHELEICVYGKTFELLSTSTQRLRLPPRGPSEPLFFELRAPQGSGIADLRVVVYHRNNLLQSFQLVATVSADGPINEHETYSAASVEPLVIRLTASALTDLNEASALKPRALSVATNDDSQPGQHTLMIKGEGPGIDAPVDEAALTEVNKTFSAVLERAHDGDASFDETVRDLAQLGSRLSRLLERSRRSDDTTLQDLKRSENRTVQFARHGNRLNLPWQLVYDFKLPKGEQFKFPQICPGGPVVGDWPQANQCGCRHCPGKSVICFEGFWAYRHYLELISEDAPPVAQDSPPRALQIRAALPHPLLTFGWSVVPALASSLADTWRQTWKGRVHEITAADAPVNECLWRSDRQPAMLVLLSHLHAAEPQSNLARRVYACSPEEEEHEISADNLLEAKSTLNTWQDPARPVVLLLACDSAGRDLGDLIDLTDTFLQTGAAAVVGTSWDIRAGPALSFAEHAAKGLLVNKQSLGQVMRSHYRAAFEAREGIPLLLTAYGNADLSIAGDLS